MKPLAIDFAPRPPARRTAAWLAGGAGMAALLFASTAWLLTTPVEASRMNEAAPRILPSAEEAQAIDAAVGALNRPWLAVLDALAASVGSDLQLTAIEADPAQSSLRLTGMARDAAAVQVLPGALRAQPAIADVRLLGQEPQADSTGYPIRFTLELRWREAA